MEKKKEKKEQKERKKNAVSPFKVVLDCTNQPKVQLANSVFCTALTVHTHFCQAHNFTARAVRALTSWKQVGVVKTKKNREEEREKKKQPTTDHTASKIRKQRRYDTLNRALVRSAGTHKPSHAVVPQLPRQTINHTHIAASAKRLVEQDDISEKKGNQQEENKTETGAKGSAQNNHRDSHPLSPARRPRRLASRRQRARRPFQGLDGLRKVSKIQKPRPSPDVVATPRPAP